MNTEKIEKLKKGLTNSQIPETLKDKIREQIKRLEAEDKQSEDFEKEIKQEVKAIEKSTAKEPIVRKPRATKPVTQKTTTAKPSQTRKPKRTAMSLAKEIRKQGEGWNDARARASKMMKEDSKDFSKTVETELEKLTKIVRSQKSKAKLVGISKTDISRDAVRKAKPRGIRTVTHSGETSNQYGTFNNKLGRRYTENRDRHSDRLAPNYPKNAPYLADGGYLTDPNFGNFQNTGSFAEGGYFDKLEDVKFLFNVGETIKIPQMNNGKLQLVNAEVIEQYPAEQNDGTYFPFYYVRGYFEKGQGKSFYNQEQILEYGNKPKNFFAKGGGIKRKNGQNYDFGRVWTNDHYQFDKKADHEVEYRRKKFELGGNVVTDLAGHTGGKLGTGDPSMLYGFSNTAYTGLVGETGAMSSGEMFEGGGAIEKKNITMAKRLKVKQWYLKTYPTDNLGEEINPTIDFWLLWIYMSQNYNFYNIIGVGDSLIRERVFEKLSEILGINYEVIYKKWLNSDDYELGGGLPNGVSQPYMITEALGNPAQHFATGGAIKKEIAFIISNDYIGRLDLGFYNIDLADDYVAYNSFFRLSDASKELFDYLKSDDGIAMCKYNPKSNFSIIKKYANGKKDYRGDNEIIEKTVFKISAKEVDNLRSIRRLEAGGNFQTNVYAQGGSLEAHGIEVGDTFIKTISGGIQKVKDKNGKIVYIDLSNGERDSQPPLPFAYGGGVQDGIEEDIDMTDDYVLRVRKPAMPERKISNLELAEKHNSGAYEFMGKDKMANDVKDNRLSEYSNTALIDMKINLSRYENTEKDIQDIKSILEKRKANQKMATGGALVGNQKRIDMNKNGKIDAEDFKLLRSSMNGAWRNERKHVNHSEDYEVRYAKPRPNRTGYKGKRKFGEGGGISNFERLSRVVARNYEGKRVKPQYQKEYGKVYNKSEAKEVGNKVAGKMKMMKKAESGAEVKKGARGGIMLLAKQIRKEGESWQDALKRAGQQLK